VFPKRPPTRVPAAWQHILAGEAYGKFVNFLNFIIDSPALKEILKNMGSRVAVNDLAIKSTSFINLSRDPLLKKEC